MNNQTKIAYFSMEIAIEENMPTYSGGLRSISGRYDFCCPKPQNSNSWWIEGCIEGITGWSIAGDGQKYESKNDSPEDAFWLYEKLEKVIVPMFYKEGERFVSIMQHCIALNVSFFNIKRMLQQYVLNAYFK